MNDNELMNIYQMVNNIILQMDKEETPENVELFEKIRWAFCEMEHMIVTMSNAYWDMRCSFDSFSEAFESFKEEIEFKYKKPKDAGDVNEDICSK